MPDEKNESKNKRVVNIIVTNSQSKSIPITFNANSNQNPVPNPSSNLTSNSNTNDLASQPSVVLYDNDFDLYTLLKDMNAKGVQKTNFSISSTSGIDRAKRSIHLYKKNSTKSLTARLLDSHFTNGKTEWSLVENGMDLYRSKIKCIGTQMKDFGYGEAVFFDLQPLSTRIKLMCKLIIIIQGACIERSGPPKLVQDRCLQFDGINSDENEANQQKHQNELSRIKSNSCENLLNDLNGSHLTKNELTIDDTENTKVSVFGTSYSKLKNPDAFRSPMVKRVGRKKSIRDNAMMSDEETSSVSSSSTSASAARTPDNFKNVCIDISADMEHYYTHRKSKHSSKAYASAPYYQYSSRDQLNKTEMSTNTTNSYLYVLSKEKNTVINGGNDLSTQFPRTTQSTSTDGLLSEFQLGYFSKQQLLSSQSLFKKKTSLLDSSVSLDPTKYAHNSVPIYINVNTKVDARTRIPMAKVESFEKIVQEDNHPNNKTTLSHLKTILSDEEEEKWLRLKMGPKKSSEWSIFKNNRSENLDTSTKRELIFKSPTVINISSITTTTTTTTTTTKNTSSSSTDHTSKNENDLKKGEGDGENGIQENETNIEQH